MLHIHIQSTLYTYYIKFKIQRTQRPLFLIVCCVFLVLNTGQFSPCSLLSVWLLSTSWSKDGAHGCPRLPSPLDFWASTAIGQLLAMSSFPGNTLIELHPSKYFVICSINFSLAMADYWQIAVPYQWLDLWIAVMQLSVHSALPHCVTREKRTDPHYLKS